MAISHAAPLVFRPTGVTDTLDSTNSPTGSLQSSQNLVPNPTTNNTWVPRPASVQKTGFSGFTTPAFVSALLVVGNIAYGMIASAKNALHDEPFAYNIVTNTFETITGVTAANTPVSPATTGDWTPPIMAVVGSRIIVTHPGFAGGSPGFFFGWFDITSLNDATHTGSTHSSTTVDTLSADVLQAGWTPGMLITSSAGDITPGTYIKSIAADGLSLVLSAAATGSNAGSTLTVTGGTATAPLWAAGNTNGNGLSAVPVGVAQMAGRAYYAVGIGTVFSDSGNALQVTNATQALTFANGVNATAIGPLPLLSPITGGIVQSLIVFQGVTAMQIISGDASISAGNTGALTVNILKAGTGTQAPLSIVPFNNGLAFVSPEGLRVVTFEATVTDPIGDHGTGVAIPFIDAVNPSRIAAASNADTLRITVKNGNATGSPTQEWCFDLTRKIWHGPHTFPASQIQPWAATFLMAPFGITKSLWQSDISPNINSTYTENGAVLSWQYWTSLLPDNEAMAMNAMVETAFAANYPPATNVTIQALDETGAVLDTVFQMGSGQSATIWGAFVWGGALWLGGAGFFKQQRVSWHIPLVFKQSSLLITGNSLTGLVLGNLYMRYQKLGYLLETVLQ